MKYDAIVAGGSFAGLALAAQLRGKILLIDRQEIGSGQTSACGTILGVAERLGVMDSVLQVHNHFEINLGSRQVRFDLTYPFCTFDYRHLCQILLERVDAEVLIARVKGVQEHGVLTDKGYYESDRIIDATGWRATLACSVNSDYAVKRQMSFGLETEVPYRAEGLQFWTDRKVLKNDAVTWIFPAGEFSRVGISSYAGRTNLKKGLENFLGGLGLAVGEELYGGYFPWALLAPTAGDIFVVGDAAGQCFGLSGEGIRSSLYFGQVCGQIVQQAIEGGLTLVAAQAKYTAFVKRHAIYFRAMHALQRLFPHLSDFQLYFAGSLIGLKPVLYFLMWQYWKGSDPDLLSCRQAQGVV